MEWWSDGVHGNGSTATATAARNTPSIHPSNTPTLHRSITPIQRLSAAARTAATPFAAKGHEVVGRTVDARLTEWWCDCRLLGSTRHSLAERAMPDELTGFRAVDFAHGVLCAAETGALHTFKPVIRETTRQTAYTFHPDRRDTPLLTRNSSGSKTIQRS